MLVRAHCGVTQGFHPGQYGCRAGRAAVNAVAVTIAHTQEVWNRIPGAFFMDVAAAFPSVASGCPLRKMCNMGLKQPGQVDIELHAGSQAHHKRRRTGRRGAGATIGLLQGSPISPVLSAIHIADIHQAAES